MDNITTLDPLPREDVTETPTTINLLVWNMTSASPQDSSNSTHTNWTAADAAVGHGLSWTAVWLYLAVRILWGGLAIFGNSLTIFAVTRFERLQTCTNYFICSLAVSDLLIAVSVPLIMVYELYPNRWFFIPVCLVQKTLSIISSSGNLLNILYLSIDRYIYIAFALRYHGLVTPRRTFIILGITWSCCLLITPTIVFKGNHLQLGMPCQHRIFLIDWVKMIYFAPQLVLVVLLTIGFHLAIARIAYKQARQIQAEQQPYNSLAVAINQSTKKISRTLGMVLGVYLLSYMPQGIIGLMMYESGFANNFSSWVRYANLFYWTNTWVNPIIYAWRLKDFRIAFKKIFTGTGSFNEVPGIIV